MMNRFFTLLLAASCLTAVGQVENAGLAECEPATSNTIVAFNRIRTMISANGILWNEQVQSSAAYELDNSGKSVFYASSLWMGGYDENGNLMVAGETFGEEGGYRTGPLSVGTANSTPEICAQFDRIFLNHRAKSERHLAYFTALSNGEEGEVFPNGYVTPPEFYDWPAHGDVAQGYDYYLAPFFDFDGDGEYNPNLGDCPKFEMNGTGLRGDKNWFWIMNDGGFGPGSATPIGVEIRAQVWGVDTETEALSQTSFVTYHLINRSSTAVEEFVLGNWVDPDIGNAADDYVGCDVARGLAYAYNGDEFDEPGFETGGFGEHPPAAGLLFVEGLQVEDDGLDNPLVQSLPDALESQGLLYERLGSGYGDGVIDNERFGMRRFAYYSKSNNSVNGRPNTPLQFYNYMNGLWKNGQQMVYGGDGLSEFSGANLDIQADYMFPGDTDPYNFGTGGVTQGPCPWTEPNAGMPPLDQRFIVSTPPRSFLPGEMLDFTTAQLYARSFSSAISSVDLLRHYSDQIQTQFDNAFTGGGCLQSDAMNYDSSSTFDDGSCLYGEFGQGYCGPGTAWSHALQQCTTLSTGDFNADGCVNSSDLLFFLTSYGTCPIVGCADINACNYNASATVNDGSCNYPILGYTCDGACEQDIDADGTCDAIDLCIDTTACNFNVFSNDNCIYIDALGECGGACVVDSDDDGICDNIDSCIGAYDECGVCNGNGPTFPVIDQITPTYDSVYAENIDTWFVYEIGADTSYTYICEALAGCGVPVEFGGYSYSTVAVGGQCWFAENLRSENYQNGEAIPANLTDSEWENTMSGAVAVYGESLACEDFLSDIDACDSFQSLNEFGRLYNWYAVDDARGLCPAGWHVPSDGEWAVMIDLLGGSSVAGTFMKTTDGWFSGGGGTNVSGFSGLPGGYCPADHSFEATGGTGVWWSSSQSESNAFYRSLAYGSEGVGRGALSQRWGFSIRCIKDAE